MRKSPSVQQTCQHHFHPTGPLTQLKHYDVPAKVLQVCDLDLPMSSKGRIGSPIVLDDEMADREPAMRGRTAAEDINGTQHCMFYSKNGRITCAFRLPGYRWGFHIRSTWKGLEGTATVCPRAVLPYLLGWTHESASCFRCTFAACLSHYDDVLLFGHSCSVTQSLRSHPTT